MTLSDPNFYEKNRELILDYNREVAGLLDLLCANYPRITWSGGYIPTASDSVNQFPGLLVRLADQEAESLLPAFSAKVFGSITVNGERLAFSHIISLELFAHHKSKAAKIIEHVLIPSLAHSIGMALFRNPLGGIK